MSFIVLAFYCALCSYVVNFFYPTRTVQLHCFDGHIQNILIAEYPDKLLLLDGCSRSDWKTIHHFITHRLQRDITELKLAVSTHPHPDHSGGAQQLRQRFGIPIAAPYNIDTWYAGLGGFAQHIIDMGLEWFVVFRQGHRRASVWHNRFVRPQFLLHHNDTLPFFPDWQVLSTPGHTACDISLYHSTTHSLYVADMVVRLREKFIPPYPVTIPLQLQQSLKIIQQLHTEHLYMAHGAPIHNLDNQLFDQVASYIGQKLRFPFTAIAPFTRLSPALRKE